MDTTFKIGDRVRHYDFNIGDGPGTVEAINACRCASYLGSKGPSCGHQRVTVRWTGVPVGAEVSELGSYVLVLVKTELR